MGSHSQTVVAVLFSTYFFIVVVFVLFPRFFVTFDINVFFHVFFHVFLCDFCAIYTCIYCVTRVVVWSVFWVFAVRQDLLERQKNAAFAAEDKAKDLQLTVMGLSADKHIIAVSRQPYGVGWGGVGGGVGGAWRRDLIVRSVGAPFFTVVFGLFS